MMDQPMQQGIRQDEMGYLFPLDINLTGIAHKSTFLKHATIPKLTEPEKPGIVTPPLSGSPELGGIDPAQPIPRLDLAGSDGVPTAAERARSTKSPSEDIHTPDFGLPAMDTPDLRPYNLVTPGIDYAYSTEFAPDALIYDLSEYARPYGLDIQNLMRDKVDSFQPDAPESLQMIDSSLQADPRMADLQHPQLEQERHMLERPGDLALDALNVMHAQRANDEASIPYSQLFMDQVGTNSTRRRHMNFLQSGLDE